MTTESRWDIEEILAEKAKWVEEDRKNREPCPRCGVDTRYYGCFCFEPLPSPPAAGE